MRGSLRAATVLMITLLGAWSTHVSAKESSRVVVRFAPGAVAAPNELGDQRVMSHRFRSPATARAIESLGSPRMSRLFPDWKPEMRFSHNALGETILLEDLSDFYVLDFDDASRAGWASSRLRGMQDVTAAAPDAMGRLTSVPNDTYFGVQWYLNNTCQSLGCSTPPACVSDADINAPEAWDIWTGESNTIKVAVMDTGILSTHPDLSGRVDAGCNYAASPCVDGSMQEVHCQGSTEDVAGHGTMCAGVIAAITDNAQGLAGINRGAHVVPYRIYDCYFNTYASWLADAFGDFNSTTIPIISISSAFPPSLAVPQAVKNCYYNGKLIVASMGNYDTSERNYPAAFDGAVFAVGAISPDGNRWTDPGTGAGSTYGDWIDVCAPGSYFPDLKTTSPWYDLVGSDCAGGFSGTSAATPVVAGVASLVLSKYPTLVGDDLAEILRRTARNVVVAGEDPSGFDPQTGAGLVRADAALQYLQAPKTLTHAQVGSFANDVTTTGTVTFTGVPGYTDGSYSVRRHQLRKAVTFATPYLTTPTVWVRGSGTIGVRNQDPYLYEREVYSGSVVDGTLTTDGCTLETYVFEILDGGGQTLSWYPVQPSQALVAYTVVGQPDNVAPGAITSLTVDWTSQTQAGVYWTATGDDGNVGTADHYELRYSLSAITSANFASATLASSPAPAVAGTPQEATISGLTKCKKYYFAIKAIDDAGNAGALGNVPWANLLCGPGGGAIATVREAELNLAGANPARGAAPLEYAIPAKDAGGTFDLAVYDVGGRRIRGLAAGNGRMGRYETSWDLRREDGTSVSDGVYFVRLTVPSAKLARKVTVLGGR